MWETAAFGAGFLLVAAGALSLIYPLRWIGVRTRFAALVVVTAGFFVVALGAKMLDSYPVYLGLALAFLGLISMMWPLRFVFIRSRRVASLVFAFGVLLATAVSLLPYREKHAATATTKLDDWMPRWQVGERHSIEIAAAPEKGFVAIHAVRADEISFFRTLTAIRRCGQDGPENILNAPEQKPILDVATEKTFVLLDDDAPREIVIGTAIAAPKRSEEHTSELQSRSDLVCRLLLEKKKTAIRRSTRCVERSEGQKLPSATSPVLPGNTRTRSSQLEPPSLRGRRSARCPVAEGTRSC